MVNIKVPPTASFNEALRLAIAQLVERGLTAQFVRAHKYATNWTLTFQLSR